MTYKIDEKNLKGSFVLANLFLLIAFIASLIIGSLIVPTKVKEYIYTEKVEAYDTDLYYYSTDKEYCIKFIYYVDGTQYTHIADDAATDDYSKVLYYKKDKPNYAISEFEIKKANKYMFLLIIPGLFLIISTILRINSWLKVAKIKRLCIKGILVKNIPYKLISTNLNVDDKTIMAFCITYTFPDGITRELISNGIYKDVEETGWCDMLYDPNNYKNYYIEKSIRITGKGSPVIIHYK